MAVQKGGHELQCTSSAGCSTSWFPRTDPVVIMLLIDPSSDRALLGRQARWAPGVYSCLAGFMEHGEALEEAVARETLEESGLVARQMRYHSSQPWPFPYSLMLGFVARAVTTTLNIDPHELEAAIWVDRPTMAAMLAAGDAASQQPVEASPNLAVDTPVVPRTPPAGTIAHQLCRCFAERHPITLYSDAPAAASS